MIEQTLKRISHQLEMLTKSNITLERALDLLEATTQDMEELVAINTLRESLTEVISAPVRKATELPMGMPSFKDSARMPYAHA